MKYYHFSSSERLDLSILLKKGHSLRIIAEAMKRHPSSVSRELKRNCVNGSYESDKALHKAYVKRRYSKYVGMKVRERPSLERYIQTCLVSGWTPEAIAGRLKEENRNQTVISFKSIYKYLYSSYGQAWSRYLPSRRHTQRPRGKRKKTDRIHIPDRVWIEARPQVIKERQRLGDFEGDLLGVPRTSRTTLAGIVERRSLYVALRKAYSPIKDAVPSYQKLCAGVSQVRPVYSMTLDNALGHAKYQELGIPTYFCHPYRAWEKGTLENTFQRLRRFIPKPARIDDYSQTDIDWIAELMNHTPRKRLGYMTPHEVFHELPMAQTALSVIPRCCT